MPSLKILYAGDSQAGGPANYLLAVLRYLKADFRHLPPSETLHSRLLQNKFDAIILSDCSRRKTPASSQKAIVRQVEEGTGLLMVGGWASFSGPSGGWQGTALEKILPVSCLKRDDRIAFPSGALLGLKENHPILGKISFGEPPVLCGLNEIRPKHSARVILTARKIVAVGNRVVLDPYEYPLLVVSSKSRARSAAFATDLAPHWCGGLLDWGQKCLRLPVNAKISVEVGDLYLRFVSSLITWLAQP